MSEGSGLSAELNYTAIPKLEAAIGYTKQFILPDATFRNWNAYGEKVHIAPTIDATESFALLNDPQTNGGLLIAIKPGELESILKLFQKNNISVSEIGIFSRKQNKSVSVN
jgi:selenide,water dikinase